LIGNVTVIHEREGGVAAFDYAVRARAQRPRPDIPIGVWEAAAASAAGEEAELVGERAFSAGHLHVALEALSAAARSTQPELGAHALYNKGVTLGQLDRSEEAIAVYNEVDSRYRDDPTPTLREHVAQALNNKGVRLTQLDRFEEAAFAYRQSLRIRTDDANTLSNAAQLDFARGFDSHGSEKAHRALQLAGQDPQLGPLRAEANFCLFAHNPQGRMRSGASLKQSLGVGVATGEWNFQPNIRRLRDLNDPRVGLVQALAEALAKGDPSGLDVFDEWRDLPKDFAT